MPTPQLAKQAEAVRADITRLEADLEALLKSVGGAIGASIRGRATEALKSVSSHVEPLLAMLGASGAPAKRGPGRPRREAGDAAPRKRSRRRGGRGRKVNLTAEKISAALKETGGNKSAAAKLLRVSQPTFYKYLESTKAAPAEQPKPAKKAATAPKKAAPSPKSKK